MEQSKKKWYDNNVLTNVLLILYFPVGLYALWKSNTTAKWWKTTATAIIIIALSVVLSVVASLENGSLQTGSSYSTQESEAIDKPPEPEYIQVGQPLTTRYFEVTINEVNIRTSVSTGNPFTGLKQEDGTLYLILNATFKNIDDESRILTDGNVLINYNGKDYKFDYSETILADGWGLFLDQINPLTSKTTNLVYKIPREIKGPAFYRPGRASRDDLILLGNLE